MSEPLFGKKPAPEPPPKGMFWKCKCGRMVFQHQDSCPSCGEGRQ